MMYTMILTESQIRDIRASVGTMVSAFELDIFDYNDNVKRTDYARLRFLFEMFDEYIEQNLEYRKGHWDELKRFYW